MQVVGGKERCALLGGLFREQVGVKNVSGRRGWAAQCHLWMDPPPCNCVLQSFPGPGFILKAGGASTFHFQEVSCHSHEARAKVGVKTLDGSKCSRIERAPDQSLCGGKGEMAPPQATVRREKPRLLPWGACGG